MKRKTALVTGASKGIGKATAYALAKDGCDLVLNCCHSEKELFSFAKSLEKTFSVHTLCCIGDIGDFKFTESMFDKISEFCNGIDILINNAAISYIGLLTDMSFEEWNRVIQTNLSSVFSCCRLAIPHMVSQKSGKIINISSAWGEVGASCEVAYSASKGGINAFTKSLAKELAPSNIQVNAVACGVIDTSMNQCFNEEERLALAEEIPFGRFGTPEETADFILQLIHAPSHLTGQIIRFDGGWI